MIETERNNRPAIWPAETPAQVETALQRAADLLRAGQVVGAPTETVYGLAANAWDEAAARRIFEVKGRPAHNPLIVHVSSLEMARQCVSQWPELAERLARAFWPGPLTLVLPKADSIPEVVTAGGTTVALRWPAHPLMQQLITRCGFPLAAPSANLSNQVSPTTARHVAESLKNRLEMVIDGGPARIGIESTVLDLSVHPPRLLRPGMIPISDLRALAGRVLSPEDGLATSSDPAAPLRSPGQLKRHYSPRAPLQVRSWPSWSELRQDLLQHGYSPERVCILTHSHAPDPRFGGMSVLSASPREYARQLYAALHQSDQPGMELIVVEAVPATPEWDAIRDRLCRAAIA